MTLLATPTRVLCALGLATTLAGPEPARAADWRDALAQQVERIDADTPGTFGIYVKRLDNGETYAYQADRRWYLSSSAKLPVAIAVLQEVDARRWRMDQTLVLKDIDKVDGSGDLVWQATGAVRRVDWLVERMLMVSDNTAANLLIRTLGGDKLNERARQYMGADQVGTLTDFAQVRYDVYAELHPSARRLVNRQLVEIAAAPMGPKRVENVSRMLGIDKSALQQKTMEDAYARYYARGLNAGTLTGYGAMLEKLVRGQLLSPPLTQSLFQDLKFDSYDAYRLEAGLPRSVRFIHKTGTQLRRACHMGVINPQDQGRQAIVVATCAENMDENKDGGRIFERLGKAITTTLLAPR